MKTLVVIVNFRTAQLTIDCLESLQHEIFLARGDRVMVVDGHSEDGSVEAIQNAVIQQGWAEWVSVVPLEQNGGFAFANNAALRRALDSDAPPDCFWLLNPDTIVRPGALEPLIGFLQDHPQAGIVGSRVESRDGEPEHASFRFPTLWSELDLHLRWGVVTRMLHKRIVAPPIEQARHRAEWVNGASLMIRRKVLADIGLMDEQYFLYYEETDLCLRAVRAGWECWSIPESRVIHLGGQATGILHSNREQRPRPAYWFQSRRRFFIKHYGQTYAAATDAVSIAGLAVWNVRRLIQRKPQFNPPRFLRDLCRHSVLNPWATK